MKSYLGWDCANKSIAWAHITINTEIYNLISQQAELLLAATGLKLADLRSSVLIHDAIITNGTINEPIMQIFKDTNTILDTFLQIHDIGAADILKGRAVKDTTEMERTRALYDFLQNSNVRSDKIQNTTPIIEHQPNKMGFGRTFKTNSKSTAVSHQLAFYYITHDPCFIDPKLKNNIALSDDLTYNQFYTEAKSRYKNEKDVKYYSRKKHSVANFQYLVHTFGLDHKIAHIPNSMMDDVADSFLQILAKNLAVL